MSVTMRSPALWEGYALHYVRHQQSDLDPEGFQLHPTMCKEVKLKGTTPISFHLVTLD